MFIIMLKHDDYEYIFNELEITKDEASVLMRYLTELAKIGIEFLTNKKENEELCNLDESINQASRGLRRVVG